jgi:hypothetical protein
MKGKRVCRMHGAKGGGPRGECNGNYRMGRYTAEAKAERRSVRDLMREVREAIDIAKILGLPSRPTHNSTHNSEPLKASSRLPCPTIEQAAGSAPAMRNACCRRN